MELVDHDEGVVVVAHEEVVVLAGLVRVDHHDVHDEDFDEGVQELDEDVVGAVLVDVFLTPPKKLRMLRHSFWSVSLSR